MLPRQTRAVCYSRKESSSDGSDRPMMVDVESRSRKTEKVETRRCTSRECRVLADSDGQIENLHSKYRRGDHWDLKSGEGQKERVWWG